MNHERSRFNEQDRLDPLRIRVFLIRHGEQATYTDSDSKLTPLGRQQINTLGEELCGKFLQEGNNKRIRVLNSSRPRAIESADILTKFLKKKTREDGTLYGSEVRRPMIWDELQTADAIGPLLDDGVPKENVCAAWLNLPEETLQEYGAQTPHQIKDWILEQTQELEDYSKIIHKFQPHQPEINILWISHETTIWGAFLMSPHMDIPATPVNHASYIQIDIAHGDKPTTYTFNGHQFYPNGAEENSLWTP